MSTPSWSGSGALRVLISYAHRDAGWTDEMVARRGKDVRRLAQGLRENGIDAEADFYHQNEDWTRLGPRMVSDADIVLIVASQAWSDAWLARGDRSRNLGVGAETDAVRSIEQAGRGSLVTKCRLLMLPGTPQDQIPIQLHTLTRYVLNAFDDAALEELVRDLTGQPRMIRPPLGAVPHLSPGPIEADTPSWRPLGAASSEAAAVPPPVPWQQVQEAVTITWRGDAPGGFLRVTGQNDPSLTAILVPVSQRKISQRVLGEMQDGVVRVLRSQHLLADSIGVSATLDETGVSALVPSARRGYNDPSPAEFRGCTVARDGQVTVWSSLPRDSFGAVLDRAHGVDSLAGGFALAVRLLEMIGVTGEVAVATEVYPVQSLTSGTVDDLGRRNGVGTIGAGMRELRVEPEEQLDAAWLSQPANAKTVASTLIEMLARRL